MRKGSRKTGCSASKIARFACDRVSLVPFWPGVKNHGTHLEEILTFLIHCAECFLLAHGRCQLYWLADSHLNICHPSQFCGHEQCFPQSLLFWVFQFIIFEAVCAHLKMCCPPFHHEGGAGAPVAQWIKRWPTDLANRVRSSLEMKSSQP